MQKISMSCDMSSGEERTEITVGSSLGPMFAEYAAGFGHTAVIVSSGVMRNMKSMVESFTSIIPSTHIIEIDDGEQAKSFESYSELMTELSSLGLTRRDLLAYIGGGTVGDVSGFASATYMRGIRMAAVPTTLLAQVDSAVGGKNGVNISGIKNLAGTFHNPSAIYCDTGFLKGMDERLLKNSLGEVVKYGIIDDTGILESMNSFSSAAEFIGSDIEKVVSRCIEIKKEVVEKDPLETKGIRQILNAGHTVAHALEGASLNRMSHGNAVLVGLVAESEISEALTGTRNGVAQIIRELQHRYSLDLAIPDGVETGSVMSYARNDKKIEGDSIVFPLILGPGRIELRKLKAETLMKEIENWCRKNLES